MVLGKGLWPDKRFAIVQTDISKSWMSLQFSAFIGQQKNRRKFSTSEQAGIENRSLATLFEQVCP